MKTSHSRSASKPTGLDHVTGEYLDRDERRNPIARRICFFLAFVSSCAGLFIQFTGSAPNPKTNEQIELFVFQEINEEVLVEPPDEIVENVRDVNAGTDSLLMEISLANLETTKVFADELNQARESAYQPIMNIHSRLASIPEKRSQVFEEKNDSIAALDGKKELIESEIDTIDGKLKTLAALDKQRERIVREAKEQQDELLGEAEAGLVAVEERLTQEYDGDDGSPEGLGVQIESVRTAKRKLQNARDSPDDKSALVDAEIALKNLQNNLVGEDAIGMLPSLEFTTDWTENWEHRTEFEDLDSDREVMNERREFLAEDLEAYRSSYDQELNKVLEKYESELNGVEEEERQLEADQKKAIMNAQDQLHSYKLRASQEYLDRRNADLISENIRLRERLESELKFRSDILRDVERFQDGVMYREFGELKSILSDTSGNLKTLVALSNSVTTSANGDEREVYTILTTFLGAFAAVATVLGVWFEISSRYRRSSSNGDSINSAPSADASSP